MRVHRGAAVLLVCALTAFSAGCGGDPGGSADGGAPESGGTVASTLPGAFAGAAGSKDLAITAEGGGVGLSTGDAYAAVSVPAGAAAAGSTWKVTPLAEAPSGVEKPLCPGVYVETEGADPTGWCAVGFSLPGTASPDATIVRLADDGTVAEVVPTERLDYGERTFLTAYVDGFSAYTTAEEDQAARDQAFQDRAKAKGQQVDWTIKAIGTETQDVQGWKFTYDLDLFASGGGVGIGGMYKGTCLLSMTGKYTEDLGIVQSLGDVSGGIRDQDVQFVIVDTQLANLLTGEGDGEGTVSGSGLLDGEGFGSLNIYASAPDVSGEYHSGPVSGSEPMRFYIKVTTFEDVQVEVPNVGIFPGKILRTTK